MPPRFKTVEEAFEFCRKYREFMDQEDDRFGWAMFFVVRAEINADQVAVSYFPPLGELIFSEGKEILTWTNPEGVLLIETVNIAVSRMFGYTREELIGMPVEQLVSHEYRDKHLEKVQTHDPEIFGEFDRVINGGMGLRKDGTLFPVTVELKSVLINGKPGWAAIITLE